MADPRLPWYEQAWDWTKEALGMTPDYAAVQRAKADANAAAARFGAAPTMDTTQSDEWRLRQRGLADMYGDVLAGKTPSVAELQMRQGLDASARMANSLAASGRGGVSPALLQQMAMNAATEGNQRGIAEMAILRAREQDAARGALGGLLGGARGQDIGIAGANLGAQQNASALGYNAYRGELDRGIAAAQADADRKAAMVRQLAGAGMQLATGGAAGGGGGGGGPMYTYNPNTGSSYKNAGGSYETGGVTLEWADGGIVTQPTKSVIGEAGPEAVVPLTSPEDARMAAMMIERAREKQAAEEQARAIGEMAVQMTRGPTRADAAAAGASMGDFAVQATGGPAPVMDLATLARQREMERAREMAARIGQFAVQRTGGM